MQINKYKCAVGFWGFFWNSNNNGKVSKSYGNNMQEDCGIVVMCYDLNADYECEKNWCKVLRDKKKPLFSWLL